MASQLAGRLLSVGIRRVDCIYTIVENVAFQQRCEALLAHFQAAGLIGMTHLFDRSLRPLVMALEDLSSDIAAGTVAENLTAFVLPDAPLYHLFNDARAARDLFRAVHVAVFESSLELLEDIREGKPITVVEQASYSEAYAAVALAAYELQVGEALTSDLAPSARLLSNGEVTDADMMRVLCREEGYPVCGDPGVPEVTPRGCPCFDPTSTRLELLSTVPRAAEVHHTEAAGWRDGERDFPGTQFRWDMKGETTFSAKLALEAVTAVLENATWTALVNTDHYAALVNPLISQRMEAIGRTKGNRTIWLTLDRDEDMPLQQFLDKYHADGYVGPTAWGPELLGAYARSQLRSNGDHTLVLAPLGIGVPKWSQMARGFVNGFFNHTLAYPDSLWAFPFRCYCSHEPVAFRFHDGWTQDMSPCYIPLADCAEAGAGANLSGSYPAMLDVIQTPAPLSETHIQMDAFREALRAGNVSGMNYGTVAVLPIKWEIVPLLIQQAEESQARGPQGDTKIMSFFCLSSDFQLFAYPDTIPGSSRHSACLDWQLQLTSYISYMAVQLEQQTRGERLFRGAVPTDRLLTRDSLGPRARQRMADCHLHRRRELAENGTDTSFAVCDYAAGCGGNASVDACSGRGLCQFPTALMNAQTPGGLPPSQGWCVCHKGAKGRFCELKDDNHTGLALGIALGISLPLLLLLAMVCYLRRKRRIAEAKNYVRDMVEIRSHSSGDHRAEIVMVHTDIEGSTQLWEHDPEMMDQSLQVHHRVLRLLLGIHQGYECNTEGDAFEVVFQRTGDAVRWACEVQLALLSPETLLAPRGTTPNPNLLCTWPERLLSHEVGRLVLGPDGTTLFRGLRVRMGIHRGVPELNFQHSTHGRQRYEGRVVDVARALVNAASQGGQVLMSSSTWASLTPSEIVGLNLVVHHLGEHSLTDHLMPIQLLEVLPQSLQRRAPFAPLRSRQQLSPSFFDAPGASSFFRGTPPSDLMCIMFILAKPSMRIKQNPEYESALATFISFTRRLLRTHRGYECEERNGDFLLAFGGLVDAVHFSQALQVGAMALPWPRSILAEAEAEPVQLTFPTENGNTDTPGCVLGQPATSPPWLFRGLRIKCGFYWGIPTRCLPHGSTGRAAYFGPLMNRAARIASYAKAGQTLCNSEAAEAYQEACRKMDDNAADPAVLPVTFTYIGSPLLKGMPLSVPLSQVASPLIAARVFESPVADNGRSSTDIAMHGPPAPSSPPMFYCVSTHSSGETADFITKQSSLVEMVLTREGSNSSLL
eukprot:jgi/Mesvir1/15802/Mv03362-RA.1